MPLLLSCRFPQPCSQAFTPLKSHRYAWFHFFVFHLTLLPCWYFPLEKFIATLLKMFQLRLIWEIVWPLKIKLVHKCVCVPSSPLFRDHRNISIFFNTVLGFNDSEVLRTESYGKWSVKWSSRWDLVLLQWLKKKIVFYCWRHYQDTRSTNPGNVSFV